MTSRRAAWRRLTASAVGALALFGVAACGPDPVAPDDVDADRLAVIDAQDPYSSLVAGSADAERHVDPARAAPEGTYAVAFRPAVSTTVPLADLVADADPGSPGPALVAPAARALADTITSAGWTVALVACEPSGDGETLDLAGVVATRRFDGFTAVTRTEITETGATAVTVAPFHTDPADPWSADPWDLTSLDGPACLDGDLPADSVSVAELRDTQGLRDVLPDE